MKRAGLLAVLIFVLLALPGRVWGQDYSVTVDSGYFFYEGEYFEPPYNIRATYDKIYVNNKIVWENKNVEITVERYNQFPSPPVDLTKLKNYAELKNLEYKKGYNFEKWVRFHYLKKYPYNESIEKIIGFYKELSIVDSLSLGNAKSILSVFYKNHKRIDYDILGEKDFLEDHTKYSKRDVTLAKAKMIELSLQSNRSFSIGKGCGQTSMPSTRLIEIIKILEDSSNSRDLKKGILKDIVNPKKENPSYIINYNKLLERMKKGSLIFTKDSCSLINLNNNQMDESNIVSFSPSSEKVICWSPNSYEFPSLNSYLFPNLTSDIMAYTDYTWILYEDNTAYDNDPGECTYENWLKLIDAGILFFFGHGTNSEGDFLAVNYEDNVSPSFQKWLQGNENLIFDQQTTDNNYSYRWFENDTGPEAFPIRISKEWARINFKQTLDQRKTIVFLS